MLPVHWEAKEQVVRELGKIDRTMIMMCESNDHGGNERPPRPARPKSQVGGGVCRHRQA